MDPATAVVAIGVLFVAYIVRGMAGFGSGLIAIPVLALYFPVTTVVPLVVLLDYLGSAAQGLKNLRSVSWSDLAPLVPFTLIGVIGALTVLDTLDPSTLSRALGVFVLAFAVIRMLPFPPLRGSRLAAAPYGLLGGVVGTMFGTGGPMYAIYLTLRGLEKSVFRASFAAYFVLDGSFRLVGYLAYGFFGREELLMILAAIPIAAVALYAGGLLHSRVSNEFFQRGIGVILFGSGTALVLQP